jgi:hypothetical protein
MTSADGIDVFVATLSTNTLLATTATQRQIFSSQLDNVKGLSVYLNAIYVTGGFRGKDLFFSGFPTKTLSLNSTPDLYIARYNANLSALTWSQNYTNAYSEQGMTMKVNGNLYFTYMQNNYSYISRVTPSNGVVAETQQIGTGTEFYNINDMENIGSQLYLCGYQKGAYTNTVQKSAIIHYAAPLSSIAWPPSHVIASNTWTANNEASKIVTDGTNIFVSGSFDCATPFRFGVSGSWSQIIALQGTSNHYVYKTNNILTPNIGWLAGVASAPTTAASFGNALAYDANNAVFYLGGPYNGNNITLTGSLAQVLPNSIGFDGFIARFQDNGSVADYKSVEAFEVTPIGDTEENNVTLYPNPSSGIFKVASTNNEVITEIAIADLTGRIVYRSNSGNIVNDTEINTDFLSNGTYLVSVSTELNNYKLKLLIVK